MAANSDMFLRYTVVFTTFSRPVPAACRMACRFLSTRSVCSAIPPLTTFPVAGSMATCPETNTMPAALIACEYGPIACGASFVAMTSRGFDIRRFLPQRHRVHRVVVSSSLHALHIAHAGNLTQVGDDALQVRQVSNIDHDVDGGLQVSGARGHILDIGIVVADDGGYLFQHAEAVVAEDVEADGIGGNAGGFTTRGLAPLYGDAAVGVIHQCIQVRTAPGVHGHALAAGDVTNNLLAADGVATARTIHQQVIMPHDLDGGGIRPAGSGACSWSHSQNAAHHVGEAALLGSFFFRVRLGLSLFACRNQLAYNVAGRVLSVANAGHQVVRLGATIFRSYALKVFFSNALERQLESSGFALDQLASNFDGALALVQVEPVLDPLLGPG